MFGFAESSVHASKPLIQVRVALRACPVCGRGTMVTRIMPDLPGFEERTFECVRCGDGTILALSSAHGDDARRIGPVHRSGYVRHHVRGLNGPLTLLASSQGS